MSEINAENELKEKEGDKDNNNEKNENNKEVVNKNKEEMIEEIKTKVLNSKNDFLSKMKNLIEDISKNYDNLISNLDHNENKNDSLLIFNNLENIQNNILEENKNLNLFLKNQNPAKNEEKEEKDEKILKINCNSDINKIKNKIEKSNFEKIIIKELASTSFNEIFKSYENKKYNDIILKKTNMENYNLNYIKDINKFKIKKCKVLFTLNSINFTNIKELYLENINLFNEDLKIILQELKQENLINLKILSLKNNFISKMNIISDTNIIYNSLEFLNLSSNKISKINKNIFDIIPNIKSIDLTNNNINFICRFKEALNISKNKGYILLLAKNPGIIIEKHREEYCNYLKEIIPEKLNDNTYIKYLNLEGLFMSKTYPLLSEIDFNRVEIKQLNSLDLSHNNLNDKDFVNLVEKNKIFFSKIKKLILCSNYITEVGINSLINNNNDNNEEKEDLSNVFINLKKLNLSGNPIKFTDLNQFKKMINFFPNLKTLLMKYTPFESDFNAYLKNKAINKNNKENQELTELDAQFEEILEKEKFFEDKKINIKMMDRNEYEYYDSVRKYFPYLLYNFSLENNSNEN